MREFFRGWRRKIGCVTLVMALAFMSGWSRSTHFYDKLDFPVGAHKTASVVSTNQFVGVGISFSESVPSRWGFYECKAEDTLPLNSADEDRHRNPLSYARDLVWISEWHGFGMGGSFDELPTYWLIESMIPYWSIVIPLTLLSAFLLLTKPRKSTQKKIPEPTELKGAIHNSLTRGLLVRNRFRRWTIYTNEGRRHGTIALMCRSKF